MKKRVVIVFAGLLVSAGLQAQKVCIENNKVILDLTEAAGMPAGAITATPKTWTGTPSNSSGPLSNNTETGTINEKVFQKLEVAPKDMNNAGVIGGGGTMEMNWVEAFNGCIKSTYNGGKWRLPTQRELMLMCIFKGALDTAFSKLSPSGTGIALLSASYRSATETNASNAWYVSFGTGNTNYTNDKAYSYRVRCVREVTTP